MCGALTNPVYTLIQYVIGVKQLSPLEGMEERIIAGGDSSAVLYPLEYFKSCFKMRLAPVDSSHYPGLWDMFFIESVLAHVSFPNHRCLRSLLCDAPPPLALQALYFP
jgi:hypothetical protein